MSSEYTLVYPCYSYLTQFDADGKTRIGVRESDTPDGFMTTWDTTISITQEKATFDLVLASGWNLFSIPLVNHSYKASTLPLSMMDVVVRWDTGSQRYPQPYIVGVSPLSMDFPIEDSTSYWVFSSVSRTIHLLGDVPATTQTRNITIPGTMGWAFIGFEGLNSTWHASDVIKVYNGTISSIYTFDSASKVWKMYIAGIPQTDFLVAPGKGCLIWCTSGTLMYNPIGGIHLP